MDSSIGYTDLIAVSLLDLDPSHVNGSGGVRYVDSGSALLVQWLDVPWWDVQRELSDCVLLVCGSVVG